jgi:hypothetical protein
MKMKIKRDVNKFTPYEASELIEAFSGNEKAALEMAIIQADERSRIYAIPCKWTAQFTPAGGIVVYRYRHSN